MRLVVTGAAGFIGSHLTDAALAAGHEVVGVDAFVPYYARSVKEANLAGAIEHPRFRLVEADLRVDELDAIVDGADAVVHLAAMPGLPRSWTDFELYTSCNVIATERLLEALRRTGKTRLLPLSPPSGDGGAGVGGGGPPTTPA